MWSIIIAGKPLGGEADGRPDTETAGAREWVGFERDERGVLVDLLSEKYVCHD